MMIAYPGAGAFPLSAMSAACAEFCRRGVGGRGEWSDLHATKDVGWPRAHSTVSLVLLGQLSWWGSLVGVIPASRLYARNGFDSSEAGGRL